MVYWFINVVGMMLISAILISILKTNNKNEGCPDRQLNYPPPKLYHVQIRHNWFISQLLSLLFDNIAQYVERIQMVSQFGNDLWAVDFG